VAELQEQQKQRGIHRPHLGDQGALLLAGDRGTQNLRKVVAEQRARRCGVRAINLGYPCSL
jgi:hypothetical protein